jgi:hypothetical protein
VEVRNGYKVIGNETAIVANCENFPHDPAEMKRYPPYGDSVPYRWERVDR